MYDFVVFELNRSKIKLKFLYKLKIFWTLQSFNLCFQKDICAMYCTRI